MSSTIKFRQRGFTLIEILVVVVIVGILYSLLTLSVGVIGSESDARRETERLEALISLARDEATLGGAELGLRFFPDSYEFSRYEWDEQLWLPLADDEALRERQVPAGTVMELVLEGREIALAERGSEKREDYAPQVVIFSSGEVQPFELILRPEFESAEYRLVVEASGRTQVVDDDDYR